MRLPERKQALGWAAVLVVLAACLTLYLQFISPNIVGFYVDGAYYLQGGQALAKGLGYIRFNDPTHPALTVYPPLLPALFSLLWRIAPHFPDNLPLFKGFEFFLLLMANAVFYAYCVYVRKLPIVVGLLLCLPILLDYQLFGFALSVMSEPLYLLLSLLCLIWFERRLTIPQPCWQDLVIMALLCSALYYTRTVGSAMIIAAGLVLWRQHGWKTMSLFLGVTLALCLPWNVWAALQPAGIYPVSPDVTFLSFDVPYLKMTQLKIVQFGGLLPLVGFNLLLFLTSLSRTWFKLLEFYSAHLAVMGGGLLVSIATCGGGLFAGARSLRGRWSLPACYLLIYLLMILSWFAGLVMYRFLLMILPLIWIYSYKGLSIVFKRQPKAPPVIISILVALALWGNGLQWAKWLPYPDKTLLWFQYEPVTASRPYLWQDFQALFDFMKQHIPPEDKVFAFNEMALSLYAHANTEAYYAYSTQAQPVTWEPSPDDIEKLFQARHVRYALLHEPQLSLLDDPYLFKNRASSRLTRHLSLADRLYQAKPQLFERVFISPHALLQMYRFKL